MIYKLHLALGIAGNVTTVLLYSALILTFKGVMRKRSTEEFSCVPYVFTLLAALVYFWYGLRVVCYKWENITVVTIGGVGIILESTYILIYVWVALARRKKMAILMVLALIMVVSITTLVSTIDLRDHDHRKLFVGSIGVVVGIGMYVSPLVVTKRVIQTKRVEFMPFYLYILVLIIQHSQVSWVFLLGIPISFLQLVLYCFYWKWEIHQEPSDADL
ncbi:hypothetical protein NE237_031168 [Protea cynaroides]|uniref:Bidirectional sugar transporter SWEET n=1 Tax=Protea cynaroides TaxID=273540 RepID=A0A9Q0L1X1_9MAGN|nr:hypothetical protein NE237_031168 [Protea cynaroides]